MAIGLVLLVLGMLMAITVVVVNKPGRVAGIAWFVAHALMGAGFLAMLTSACILAWRYAP